MNVIIRGRRWKLIRKALRGCWGICDPPNTVNKAVIIHSALKGRKELEIIIHEVMHAGHWDMDEVAVEEFSKDLATILDRLGYKKQ